jgi:hypothetical protein
MNMLEIDLHGGQRADVCRWTRIDSALLYGNVLSPAAGPTWTDALTAWATVALAILAGATAVLAFLAWLKQSKEVGDQAEMLRVQAEQLVEDKKLNTEQIRVLGLQAKELGQVAADRDREAEERRRAQAEQVYIWQAPPTEHNAIGQPPEKTVQATLVNNSQLPVFNVRTRWMIGGTFWAGMTRRAAPLMPEEVDTAVAVVPAEVDLDDLIAIAFFRDRAGRPWRTYADGRLEPDETSEQQP